MEYGPQGGQAVADDAGDEASLDYYLIFAAEGDRDLGRPALGLLVEEFVLCDDFTAAGIDGAEWTPQAGDWRGSPELSRGIRADPLLRERVAVVSRREAGDAYTMLGGSPLPSERSIRARFDDRQPLPAASPLDLGTSGGSETRRYRVLFAGEFGEHGLANVGPALRLRPVGDPADPDSRVIGTATADFGGHTFTWDLRRIGRGIAWCLDVTVHLGTGPATAVGRLLSHHRRAIREQGLIPVTIERFA
ncbi:hypothetical protein [Sphaerisporangium corydalis]|uniref:Uncharacterized protein n=1 Tax=Sphaerisporangium corydalis TaxID=1441875 RepID=A0ABV9EK05_9ACTN|nr:hypothetical protein [Sphaerisporangium corydalis]